MTQMWPQPMLEKFEAGRDRPVFEDGERVVTAAGMAGLIRRIAAGLRAAGIGPGDGVALMLGVTAEAFAATLAAYAVGARVAGIRPGLTGDQLRRLLDRADALLVTDELLAGLVRTPDDGRPLVAAGRPDDIARVVYTSGSTGDPKGCVRTYASMTADWTPFPDRWPPAIRELTSGLRRHLIFGTLSSVVMMDFALLALAAGGVLVVASSGFPDAIVRHRATSSMMTVGRLNQLVRDQRAEPADLSSLSALIVAGSPLDPDRLREAIDVLGPVVFHGYGQTEVGVISLVVPAEMTSEAVLASVGRPSPEIEVQIRDVQGRPVPAGAEGELFLRTPAQSSGYWDDPAETADVFTGGWVRTRDLARLGPDGYLYLLGRVRDVIIVNANLIYAGPIERVLATHPDVSEAYVLGRPDADTGEAIHAYVVPATGRVPDAGVLGAFVAERLGEAAVPRSVTVIDRVPLAPSGKPDKQALAAGPVGADPSVRAGA
jgi:fatty-acyl-CoA synthase